MIINSVEDKNPRENDGYTPLHVAAAFGNLDIYEAIMKVVEDKNPANNVGWTPLHHAAHRHDEKLCKLIIENVDNKNPEDNFGQTPETEWMKTSQRMARSMFH